MFGRDGQSGPSFYDLCRQALSGTEHGYDLLAPQFESTTFCTPTELIAQALDPLDGAGIHTALDLCCGTGSALPPLRAVADGRIVGVDFSQGMLDIAQRQADALGVELVRRDVLDLHTDASLVAAFDLVTCFGAVGHIQREDQPKFVGNIRRALKPGGRFVFLTTDEPPRWSRSNVIGQTFNAVMRVRNAIVSPPFVMFYLTFLLPEAERVLRWYDFDVAVERDRFSGDYRPLAVVTATRR